MPVRAAVAGSKASCGDIVEVEFVDGAGERVFAPLRTCFQSRFEIALSVRSARSFKGRSGFSGVWWMATTRSHVAFSSWVGRDWLIGCDFGSAVVGVAFRPFALHWQRNGVAGRYVPVGDHVRFGDGTWTVVQQSADGVILVDVADARREVSRSALLADPAFAVVSTARTRAPLPARGQGRWRHCQRRSPAMPRWWENHIVEVLRGVRSDAPAGTRPRTGYDTTVFSLRQREIAKVAELVGTGVEVSLRGFQRRRRAYEREGLLGLVDGRSRRQAGSGVDSRVVEAVRTAIVAETNRSTGTMGRLQRRVRQLPTEQDIDPDAVMPSRATFYRLVDRLSAGRHTFGSAPTRRSLAQRPDGPSGTVVAVRPGGWVCVDPTSVDPTSLDVRVVLDDATVDRAELTWMLDLATRSVPAAVLRPTTKTVDASLLLARCLTPEPMRPGWSDALRLSRSVLPYRRLVDIDARLEHSAARPRSSPPPPPPPRTGVIARTAPLATRAAGPEPLMRPYRRDQHLLPVLDHQLHRDHRGVLDPEQTLKYPGGAHAVPRSFVADP